MISFSILLLLAIVTIVISAIVLSICGMIKFVLYGDVIVCVLLIAMIIKKIINKMGY